jgi:hypothetical protein
MAVQLLVNAYTDGEQGAVREALESLATRYFRCESRAGYLRPSDGGSSQPVRPAISERVLLGSRSSGWVCCESVVTEGEGPSGQFNLPYPHKGAR